MLTEITPQRRIDDILHNAAALGIADVVVIALQHGANVNSYCTQKMTALHKAAQRGHSLICEILLVNNADKHLLSAGARKNALQYALEGNTAHHAKTAQFIEQYNPFLHQHNQDEEETKDRRSSYFRCRYHYPIAW